MGVRFPDAVKCKPNETVVFSWIVFKSRAHRDRVNARVMKDARPAKRMYPKTMRFDVERLVCGRFKIIIDVPARVPNPGDALPILSRMGCGVPGTRSSRHTLHSQRYQIALPVAYKQYPGRGWRSSTRAHHALRSEGGVGNYSTTSAGISGGTDVPNS